jgi:hypothetical protein
MPSRLRVSLIVVFWAATMSWLVVREVLPRFRAGEPPPFTIDLIDEVGTSTVDWVVEHKGKEVGTGFSQVHRLPDRTFEQRTQFKFDGLKILNQVELKKIAISYRVTAEGKLLELEGKIKVAEVDGEVQGKIENGILKWKGRLKALGQVLNGDLPDVDVSREGNIVNPMHLQNRIVGLWEGKTWSVPMFNSFDSLLPVASVSIPTLQAHVHGDNIAWSGSVVDCFRIDLSEPGKQAAFHTWVRRRDGLVLKQEGEHSGLHLVLIRQPSK